MRSQFRSEKPHIGDSTVFMSTTKGLTAKTKKVQYENSKEALFLSLSLYIYIYIYSLVLTYI